MADDKKKPEPKKEKEGAAKPKITDLARDVIGDAENSFVSLSSQRQINFILGCLMLCTALFPGLGELIGIVFGILLITSAATGKMFFNDFLDKLTPEKKKTFIGVFIGVLIVILLLYVLGIL